MPRLVLLFPLFLFFPAPGGASKPVFLSYAPPGLTFPAFSLLSCSQRGIPACFSLLCPAWSYFSHFFSSFPLPAGHPSLFFSPMPRLVSDFLQAIIFPCKSQYPFLSGPAPSVLQNSVTKSSIHTPYSLSRYPSISSFPRRFTVTVTAP